MEYKHAFTPEMIPELFVEYWNSRSAPGIASQFTDNAEFVNVVGLWWHHKKDIEKAHEFGLRVIFNKSQLRLLTTKVMQLSEDIAVVHAKMELLNQSPLGKTNDPRPRQNIFTFVAKKFGERWLCVAAHNTDIVPGMQTHIADDSGRLTAVKYSG